MQSPSLSSSSSTICEGKKKSERANPRRGGTYDVELDGLDGGKVDDLEFFGFGETEGGEVFREALDTLGCLHACGLIVSGEVLNGLTYGMSERHLVKERYGTYLDLDCAEVL
jgi:hypothetical protein